MEEVGVLVGLAALCPRIWCQYKKEVGDDITSSGLSHGKAAVGEELWGVGSSRNRELGLDPK